MLPTPLLSSLPSPSKSLAATLLGCLSIGLAGFGVGVAQTPAQDPAGSEVRSIVSTGIATLSAQGREQRIAVTIGHRGPLFSLQSLVDVLGGELEVGPLRQSHTLKLADQKIVIGPDSHVMTIGQDIVPLSQQPLLSPSDIEVPLDFLRRTFGDMAGYRFDWLGPERRLLVDQRQGRELPVDVDWVHSQGITTLLLRFPERPRYEVDWESDPVTVTVMGDRLIPSAVPKPSFDPLVERIEVGDRQIRIDLARGAAAAQPYDLDRGTRFELVLDISRDTRASSQRPISASSSPSSEFELPPRANTRMKIVVDPGHGGAEHGTVAKSGTKEKTLTLQLARRLKERLEQRLPVDVVLTRNSDDDIDHESRTAVANQNRANLFISLHLNSEPWGSSARGAETYFLSAEASDKRAADAAAFENRAGGSSEDEALQLILWDLAQNRHLAQSQRLAKLIQQELNETLDLRDRGVKQAPFRVLMGASMPAVLVELGFLSNPEEEKRLLDGAYRTQLVDSLVAAIQRYRGAGSTSAEQSATIAAPGGARP